MALPWDSKFIEFYSNIGMPCRSLNLRELDSYMLVAEVNEYLRQEYHPVGYNEYRESVKRSLKTLLDKL